jgi:hypothetical protein
MLLREIYSVDEAGGYSEEEARQLRDITPQEVKRERARHGLRWQDFVDDVGEKSMYTGEEILNWLGY